MHRETANSGNHLAAQTGVSAGNFPDADFAKSKPFPNIDLQTLEERILYSAGPVPLDVNLDAPADSIDGELLDCIEAIDMDLTCSISASFEPWDAPDSNWESAMRLGGDVLQPIFNQTPVELIVVDTSVEGYESLVTGLLDQPVNDRFFEVILLDSHSDGINQISATLESRTGISAIHIISHGRDGELRLGETILNRESLDQYQADFSSWKTSLSDGAVILIYGCDVAQTGDGETFIHELSRYLEASILASDDLTGGTESGGDWDLEFRVGDSTTEIAFSETVAADWGYSLAGASLQIEVVDINESPIAVNDAFIVDEGSLFSIDVTQNDHDPENDTLSVVVVTSPQHGTAFVNGMGIVVYQHDGSETIVDTFKYTIVDGDGLADTGTVFVGVRPVDDAPYANDDVITVAYHDTIEIRPPSLLSNDGDADDQVRIWDVQIISQPTHGTLTWEMGKLVLTPTTDFVGQDSFQYSLLVNGQTSNTATVLMNVVTPFGGSTPGTSTPGPTDEDGSGDPLDDETIDDPTTSDDDSADIEPRGRTSIDQQNTGIVTELTSIRPTVVNKSGYSSHGVYSWSENKHDLANYEPARFSTTYAYTSRAQHVSVASFASELRLSHPEIENNDLESSLVAGLLWNDLESAKRNFVPASGLIGTNEIAVSAAGFAAAAYFWMIQGGGILTAFLNATPAWSSFDVGTLIESARGTKDESIEQMVDH